MSSPIPDHAQQGLALLPMQLRGKPRVEALLGAVLRQVQELEDAVGALLRARDLSTASGASLDQLGRLVGEQRNGRSDDLFRRAVQLRVERNCSRGEPDRLIRVVRALTGSTTVTYEEPSPGVVRVSFDGQNLPGDLLRSMESIAPVGVRLDLVNSPAFAFAFSSVAQPHEPATAGGFSDVTQLQGGGLSKIL